MIIITIKSGHKFYYKGNILLQSDGIALHIDANDYDINPDHLYTWDKKVFDAIWLDDIESICGE